MIFDFTRATGVWAPEMVPGAGDWRGWDVTQSKLVSGDNGGTYAPNKPIVIGGAGIIIDASAASASCTGGVTTRTGGRVQISQAANDMPYLSPTVSRAITVPVLGNVVPVGGSVFQYMVDDKKGFGVMAALLPGGGFPSMRLQVPGRYMHIGARLRSLGLNFRFVGRPTALPTSPLSMTPQALDAVGGTAIELPAAPLVNMTSWFAGWTGFSQGIYCTPSVPAVNSGMYFRASFTGSGTTGSVEPTWPSTIGATVVDNTVTWTCIGRSGIFPFVGLTLDGYYQNNYAQTLGLDLDPAPTLAGVSSVWTETALLSVIFTQLDPRMLITSLQLVFDDIGDMSFE
jgi:hypothetical protein